jgi:hypothetical protein
VPLQRQSRRPIRTASRRTAVSVLPAQPQSKEPQPHEAVAEHPGHDDGDISILPHVVLLQIGDLPITEPVRSAAQLIPEEKPDA